MRANCDPLDTIETLLGPPARKSGGRHYYLCPAHDDTNPSFSVQTEGRWRGYWRCFVCDIHGDQIDLFCLVKGVTISDALDILCPLPANRFTAPNFNPSSELRHFLAARQWDIEVAQSLGLQVVADKFGRPRVRFPFRRNGRDVYHQDRSCYPDQSPKWLSATGPTPCPYEVDRLRNVSEEWVIVVEGLSDVVALAHDYPDCAVVGLAGASSFKMDWVQLFAGYKVCLFADNDDGGQVMRAKVSGAMPSQVWHAYVPAPHNDIDDWRRADVAGFSDALLGVLANVTRELLPAPR